MELDLAAQFQIVTRQFLSMVAGELDPHTSEDSEIDVISPFEIVLLTPSHAHWAKYGRGPGKIKNGVIEEWVAEKGIDFGFGQKSAAFVIKRSISKKGTIAWRNTGQIKDKQGNYAIKEAFNKHEAFYNVALGNIVRSELEKEFAMTYKSTFDNNLFKKFTT
jgi:hypothetical protein